MYLYAITDGTRVKIGFSQDVRKRMSSLQSGNGGVKLSLIFKVNCGTRAMAHKLEQIFHKRYAAVRHSGEWFNISAAVVLNDLEFTKTVFPVMLDVFDQEKIQQKVMNKMSRAEIEQYIESRWPSPKPRSIQPYEEEEDFYREESADLPDDFPLAVAHLSWTFADNDREMTQGDRETHIKLQDLRLSIKDVLGESYRETKGQQEPGIDESSFNFNIRWLQYTSSQRMTY